MDEVAVFGAASETFSRYNLRFINLFVHAISSSGNNFNHSNFEFFPMNVNRKNINCSIAESVKRFKEVTDECRKRSIPVRAYALLIGFSVSHILSSVDHCAQIRVVHRGLPV